MDKFIVLAHRFGIITNWFILLTFLAMVTTILITEGWDGQVGSNLYIVAGFIVILSTLQSIVLQKITEEGDT